MSRFDRQATEGGDLPALLGTATEEFRRSLERHVEQIVEAAKGQAAEIERDAARSARKKEQQLDLRAQELVQGVITRASSVLDSIELVQTAISGMLAELRAEVKALESGGSGEPASAAPPRAALDTSPDQRLAKEVSAQPSQERAAAPGPAGAAPARPGAERKAPAPPAQAQPRQATTSSSAATPQPASTPQPETASQPRVAEPAAEESSQASATAKEAKPGPLIEHAPVEPKAGQDRIADSSAEFDQMIHGEIRRMFHSGKSREDVESFLGRFELGDSYLGLLDELYSEKDPSGRRRIFGRRRDR